MVLIDYQRRDKIQHAPMRDGEGGVKGRGGYNLRLRRQQPASLG